ncbi:phage major capsid protein [Acuticoccus mangrovi]|nr:phage major capsid protein [Acuticoccus mangrovi]
MSAPETKADLAQAFTDFMGAFEVFRETNDRRLAELEHKSGADVVTTDKLARVEAALDANQRRMDEMVLKSHRPSLGGAVVAGPNEHKAAFEGYVRAGNETGLRALEKKALTGGASDAGFTVPVEVEAEVMRRLTAISPIRSIAAVRQVSGATYKKPITSAGPVTGWVAETADRDVTDAPTLSELKFDTMELYAMPAATATLLDDTAVDMDQWLADEIETAFAEQETAAFVAGTGTSKPRGFTDYTLVEESSWSWGNIGVVKTGVNGGFPVSTPADKLIDLVYTLKAGYRQNAHFVMNRSTQAAVRKMKDGDGSYLWMPPAIPGARASLLNFPVVEAEDMPDIATDEPAIAFGDFRRGYLIVDRQGLKILRDPYSSKPYVLFYTTKRVGGGVQDFDAIKMLQFSA